MLGKITRIFFKSAGILLLVLLAILVALLLAVRTYAFQTWLAGKAGEYLSAELGSEIRISSVEIDLFSRVKLGGVLVKDLHQDTLLQGTIEAEISRLDYRAQELRLNRVSLEGVTAKLIMYKGDSTFNYQFLADYFGGGSSDTSAGGWQVEPGDLELKNVTFVYRKEKYAEPPSHNINFDDIYLQGLSCSIKDPEIKGDTVTGTIKNLRAREQSGFVISSLDAKARISGRKLVCEDLRLKTPQSFVKGRIDFEAGGWEDYQDFINKVKMNCILEDSSYASFRDISAFSSELNGLGQTVAVSGIVKGYVSEMILSNLQLSFGSNTHFNGNLSISGLPDIDNTFLHFDARKLSTSYHDLVQIPSYPFSDSSRLSIPAEARRLGVVTYRGKFDGFLSDFTTYGHFKTTLGNLSTQLSIRTGKKADDLHYEGSLKTSNFDLGTLLGQNDLNALTLNLDVKGQGLSVNTIDAAVEGEISNLRYNNYNYRNIRLNGSFNKKIFNGILTSKDPNADFDFNGTVNFNNKVPEMDFISTINYLKLRQLNFTSSADSGSLSSQILINIRGDNIDNLSGQVHFDNTLYATRTRTYKLSTFNIMMDQESAEKKIRLNSEYINATAGGSFSLSKLQGAFEQMLFNYYPALFRKPPQAKKYNELFTFQVNVKKFNTINELFLPDLMLAPGSRIEGEFNSIQNKLNLQFYSDRLSYKGLYGREVLLILNENNNTVLAEVSGKAFHISDSVSLRNFNLAVNSRDRDSRYSLEWDNLQRPSNRGELKGQVSFDNTSFSVLNEKLSVTLNDSTWNLAQPHSILIRKDGTLNIQELKVSNNNQEIMVAGNLSKQPGDSLVIVTRDLVLTQFNPLLALAGLKLEGTMNGNIILSDVKGDFAFRGDLKLSSLKLNDNVIGELAAKTRYHTAGNSISLEGYTSLGLQDEAGNQVRNISFNGNYYLDRKDESLDINFEARPANLKLLNPFLTDIITIRNGYVNGSGRIRGSPSNIRIDGKFRLFNSEVKVDYTNVSYNITGDIEVMPDQIRFSDMLLREKGTRAAPQGTLNGNIFHNNFSRMQLDYDITYRNMLVLNTTEKENNLFYGRIYGSGNVGIYGFINNLNMVIVDTTTRNTRFYLPLDGPAEIGESDFIHFVKKDTIKTKKKNTLTGFNLDLSVHATPAAQVQIILDKQHGDMLNAQGQGDLRLTINTLGKFEMFGDYIITNGDYLFTLENVINKKFDIEAGSSISWSGNPMNAEIDVVTSYKQRVSVAPLLNDNTGAYNGRFPADCKLLIRGKLFSPNIAFSIDFPTLESYPKSRIASVLSDEAELNRQVFSFLLFRTFLTPLIYNANGGGVTAGRDAAASTGSELLSNRVSEFLNTYFGNLTGIGDLQLGLNYRPGTQTATDAVDVALSKQFLNNKITVDGNFGVNNSPQARNSGGLIGDVNIDYKLSEDGRYRLKGFNRTNDNTQITTAGGPYTQGIGFFYREEFETFNQLLKRYLKKKKPEPKKN